MIQSAGRAVEGTNLAGSGVTWFVRHAGSCAAFEQVKLSNWQRLDNRDIIPLTSEALRLHPLSLVTIVLPRAITFG